MTASENVPFDVYGNTNQLDTPILDSIVMRLESRGNHPHFVRMLNQYLDVMELDKAQAILDIGCGTGIAARGIARRSDFGGQVTGIDMSDHLVSAARRLANDEGIGDKIDFKVGDSRSLDLQDNSFDAVVAHTLISHVDKYQDAVQEMARVTKPGGYVALFDGDYASLTFGNPDPDEGKRFDDLIMSSVITQPRVMRLMPRILKIAGLEIVDLFTNIVCEVGKAEYWESAVESFRKVLPVAGVITQEEAAEWADGQVKDSEDGVFFGSSNYLTYVARKPS